MYSSDMAHSHIITDLPKLQLLDVALKKRWLKNYINVCAEYTKTIPDTSDAPNHTHWMVKGMPAGCPPSDSKLAFSMVRSGV
jgi:hypothetical protein